MAGIFGWDLPPGCTNRDIENAFGGGDPSPESELIQELLEAAGVEPSTIDRIVKLYDDAEYKAANCPECERRANAAEAEFDAVAKKLLEL